MYGQQHITLCTCSRIIIGLLMSQLLGHRPSLWVIHIKRTGHNPPGGPSEGWWVLMTANAAGSNCLTCLPKHGGVRDNKLLVTHSITDQRVTHSMTDQRCLTYTIARRSALTAGPTSSSAVGYYRLMQRQINNKNDTQSKVYSLMCCWLYHSHFIPKG
jgi:hypothetical protein